MTLIDFFVAAYWEDKGVGLNGVKRIISQCGNKYNQARQEYDVMRDYYSTNELLDWIDKRITYKRVAFVRLYGPSLQGQTNAPHQPKL